MDGIPLERKIAIMEMAIPKQIRHIVAADLPPAWSVYKVSTAWSETIENLRLTNAEQKEYEAIWERELNKVMKKAMMDRLAVENDPTRKYVKGKRKINS